jgi:Tol biopolymer transport system component
MFPIPRRLLPPSFLVSHGAGAPAAFANSGGCESPWISRDGRTICFVSRATNLSPDDADAAQDVYVATFNGGLVSDSTLVSRASGAAGVKGNGDSDQTHLSADGLFVAFRTVATNLAVGTSNIMVRDLTTLQTRCATVTSDALGPNAAVAFPRITSGGTHVAFGSAATNLAANGNGLYQPFLSLPGGALNWSPRTISALRETRSPTAMRT